MVVVAHYGIGTDIDTEDFS